MSHRKPLTALSLSTFQVFLFSLILFFCPLVEAGALIPVRPDWSFMEIWERPDYGLAQGLVQRSWYWGPAPFATFKESYAETPGGLRDVAYYDKGRMEITRPGGNRARPYYVTSGLLVRELISGQQQLGDYNFQTFQPANVPVSGDGPENNSISPTYASFRNLTGPAARTFGPVNTALDRSGKVTTDPALPERYPDTSSAYYDATLGHNIPAVLWRFMHLQGQITHDHRQVFAPLADWLPTFGLPITEAYWTRSKVGGVEQDVMVQLFERRLLTYTPSNPPAYQVEMGNLGRHYFAWRYGNAPTKPTPAPTYSQPPLRLVIPAIGIDTIIEFVGQKADGSMDVPTNPLDVGWYRYGAAIGEKGNSVLAGHLDWFDIGPTVFFNLRKLKSGDLVYVYTSLGTRRTFKVYDTGSYPLNNYPQERIFGDSDQSHLNLITCDGAFNPGSASYNQRLVVYTNLVE